MDIELGQTMLSKVVIDCLCALINYYNDLPTIHISALFLSGIN